MNKYSEYYEPVRQKIAEMWEWDNYFDQINYNGCHLMDKCCDYLGVSYEALNIWAWIILEPAVLIILFLLLFVRGKSRLRFIILNSSLLVAFMTMLIFHIIYVYG